MFAIVELPIKKIRLPKKALKEHPERQIKQIAASIEAYGFNDPVALDENNEVIEGIGRVLAAKQLGLKTIPVIRLEHLNEAQKKAYRIAHNKICMNTVFDLEALRVEFEALSQMDESLLVFTGFESVELDDLLKLPEIPELGPELTESLSNAKTVTCPHCGGWFMCKVVSLFAGYGGSSLGYKLAGCEVLAAIERDPNAVEIYRANFPDTSLFESDITTLDPGEIMVKLNLKPKKLDILDGSPPCQGFSMVGNARSTILETVCFWNTFDF